MQRKELLQDLYGVLAEKRDEFAKQFAKETNREFDALKADYARVFSIAITEHALSLTQRQARDARIANTKVMGAHGRSINRLTETGVKFGGGVLTDYQKNMVTRIYEYERQEKEIHFMPIPYDTLRIDQDYKRFDQEQTDKLRRFRAKYNDEYDLEEEKILQQNNRIDNVGPKQDKRKVNRVGKEHRYVAATCDLGKLFSLRLAQFVEEDAFALFNYHGSKLSEDTIAEV
eukprot:74097_1